MEGQTGNRFTRPSIAQPTAAFGYQMGERYSRDGDDELVDYCRVDLERTPGGVGVTLKGAGCGWRCENVAQQYELLEGVYRKENAVTPTRQP